MECNEQNFNLQATILTIETEAKFEAGQEAQKLQSELSFKVMKSRCIYIFLCHANLF